VRCAGRQRSSTDVLDVWQGLAACLVSNNTSWCLDAVASVIKLRSFLWSISLTWTYSVVGFTTCLHILLLLLIRYDNVNEWVEFYVLRNTLCCVVYIWSQVLLFFFFVLIRSCDLVFFLILCDVFQIAFQFYCDTCVYYFIITIIIITVFSSYCLPLASKRVHNWSFLETNLSRQSAAMVLTTKFKTNYTVSQIKRGHFIFRHNFYSC